jgi:hypothetical protein
MCQATVTHAPLLRSPSKKRISGNQWRSVGMANCGRRRTSDQHKTHTFDTLAHCSDTIYHCSITVRSLFHCLPQLPFWLVLRYRRQPRYIIQRPGRGKKNQNSAKDNQVIFTVVPDKDADILLSRRVPGLVVNSHGAI